VKTIKLTQGQVALVDNIDYEYLSQFNWYANWNRNCFRAMRHTPQVNGKRKILFIHTAVAERMGIDSRMIDHKDQNPLNNRRSNLRVATNSQNLHNCGAPSNNTTGVKGVHFHKSSGKYQAEITVKGTRYYLGLFDTIEEAKVVIVAKRKELVGEFACH